MRLSTLLLVLFVMAALAGGFAAANWAAFTAPASLNVLVASFDAPLGVVMLVVLAAFVLAFTVFMAAWQGTMLVESRRAAKELQQQRALADQAEASRFTELRGALRQESERLDARVAQAEASLRAELQDGINSLASMVGEMDDRLRKQPPGAS